MAKFGVVLFSCFYFYTKFSEAIIYYYTNYNKVLKYDFKFCVQEY